MKNFARSRRVFGDPTPPVTPPAGDAPSLTEKRVTEIISGALDGFSSSKLPTLLVEQFKPFSEQISGISELLKGLQPTPPAQPNSQETPPSNTTTPQQNAELLTLKRQMEKTQAELKDMETKRKAAEERSAATFKEAAIRDAMSSLRFASDEAREDAFNALLGKVNYDQSGNLVTEGNLPLKTFTEEFIGTKKSYLLRPEEVTGSGATAPQNTFRPGTQKGIQIDDIKPGMSDEVKKQAISEIAQAAKAYYGNR